VAAALAEMQFLNFFEALHIGLSHRNSIQS